VGMRWPPEYIRGIGKRGDDFIIIPDMGKIFTMEDGRPSASSEGLAP